jgi:hypothetical protein
VSIPTFDLGEAAGADSFAQDVVANMNFFHQNIIKPAEDLSRT